MKTPEEKNTDTPLSRESQTPIDRNISPRELTNSLQMLALQNEESKQIMQDIINSLQATIDKESSVEIPNDNSTRNMPIASLRAKDLIPGDYVVIQFNQGKQPQLAKVITVDSIANTAEILPEGQTNPIKIDAEYKWTHIVPYCIESKLLTKYGFSCISEEIVYGTTSTSWTMNMHHGQYVFNLYYTDHSWTLEANWLKGFESHTATHKGLIYIHQLHQAIKRHIDR